MKTPDKYQSLEEAWLDLCDEQPPTPGQRLIWFSGAAFGFALARGTPEQQQAALRDLHRVGTEAMARARKSL